MENLVDSRNNDTAIHCSAVTAQQYEMTGKMEEDCCLLAVRKHASLPSMQLSPWH